MSSSEHPATQRDLACTERRRRGACLMGLASNDLVAARGTAPAALVATATVSKPVL